MWTEKTDIYSLGMTFYEIATGEIPFHNEHDEIDVLESVKEGTRPTLPADCPEVCIYFCFFISLFIDFGLVCLLFFVL